MTQPNDQVPLVTVRDETEPVAARGQHRYLECGLVRRGQSVLV